jgi:glycosyltransferase involved in cell wall biosynthesis
MRIGVYHPNASWKKSGGIAVFYRKMSLAAAEKGHEVIFYSSADQDVLPELTHSNIIVIQIDDSVERHLLSYLNADTHLSRSAAFWAASMRAGVRRHINQEMDVLLTGRIPDNLLLSRVVRTPVVYQFHSNLARAGIGGQLHWKIHGAEVWLANSRTTARTLENELGATVDGVVYPGVALDQFAAATETVDGPPQITFVGRLHKEKGVQELIRAFAAIDTEADLNIVGQGAHREYFESLVDQLDVDRVTFHGGVPDEELPRYYQEATIACHPSHHESFCMTNIEAMAASTPVVTTDLPAIQEYAVDGENCRLVSPGDAEHLTSMLEELLSSPNERARLSESGRKTAEKFSWKEQFQQLLSYCRQVAKSDCNPPIETIEEEGKVVSSTAANR